LTVNYDGVAELVLVFIPPLVSDIFSIAIMFVATAIDETSGVRMFDSPLLRHRYPRGTAVYAIKRGAFRCQAMGASLAAA
jgi:hypothetical protein